jgi:hypothetical protein
VKALFILIVFLINNNASGQLKVIPGKPGQLTKKEMEEDQRNQNCFYHYKYSRQQRLQLYPFKEAKKVLLVSFAQPDSVIMGGELPLENGMVNLKLLTETKAISQEEIDSLTDLLYNQSYGGNFYSFSRSLCYNPRNAILFLDRFGQVFAFIELCFECHDYRLSSKRIKAGDFCNQKYELLRKFFAANGIAFGTKPEVYQDINE